MATCPDCGGEMRQSSAMVLRDAGGRPVEVAPPGAWCADCGYGAVDVDHVGFPHPLSRPRHVRLRELAGRRAFAAYVERIADGLPDVERAPGRCGGRPTFRDSRLTLETIVDLVVAGESDEALLESYPSLPSEALGRLRALMETSPPPRAYQASDG